MSKNSVTMKKNSTENNNNQDSRRTFIKKAAIGTAGLALFSAKSYANIIGANNRLHVGAVGFHKQGQPKEPLQKLTRTLEKCSKPRIWML